MRWHSEPEDGGGSFDEGPKVGAGRAADASPSAAWDALFCQLFHQRWAELVSYSRHGRWRCAKPGCGAQRRFDAGMAARLRLAAEPPVSAS